MIAIIGAGVSGLALAYQMSHYLPPDLGIDVFDKGRRVGGRASTFQRDGMIADFGASALKISSALELEERWEIDLFDLYPTLSCGMTPLRPPLHPQSEEEWLQAQRRGELWIAQGGMVSLLECLMRECSSIQIRLSHHVHALVSKTTGWWLEGHIGGAEAPFSFGPYQWVISTAPPEQSASLLKKHSDLLYDRLASVEENPKWSVVCEGYIPWLDGYSILESPPVQLSPILSRVSDEATRLTREVEIPERRTYVLQARAGWSQAHLDTPSEEIFLQLRQEIDELGMRFGSSQTASLEPIKIHRWRLAEPAKSLNLLSFIDETHLLAYSGDALVEGTIQGALFSAAQLAKQLRNKIVR